VRIIIAPATAGQPDLLVQSQPLPVRVKLSPNVTNVRSGTPLTEGGLGWEIARTGTQVYLFATNNGRGGDLIPVAREVVLQLPTRTLTPCAHYRIADIDETGRISLEAALDGPHIALTDESILLTPDE
jgi:hypothetical protein